MRITSAVARARLPAKVSPQLTTLVDAPPRSDGWTYEIKLDGYRILARCEDEEARLFTRNGNDWTAKLQSLARELARLSVNSAWLDGEVVVLGANGIPDFNALQNAFDTAGTEDITYFVFDVCTWTAETCAAWRFVNAARCLRRYSRATTETACA